MMSDWMPEARQMAAQCWCDPETSDRVMDAELAEAVAKRIAAWMDTAAQNERNAEYYRCLLEQCGQTIGHEAYVQDDGGICEDVLCAKVPELVDALAAEVERLGRENKSLRASLERRSADDNARWKAGLD